MMVLFVAGFGPISADVEASRRLYEDGLGIAFNAVTNATNSQQAGAMKDAQSIQSAQFAVNNAQLSLQSAVDAANVTGCSLSRSERK